MNTGLNEQTVAKLQEIIMGQLNVAREQVIAEAAIVEDLGADSLDVVEISLKVEEEFNVSIGEDRLERIGTFGELCEELGARLNHGQEA